MTPRTQQVLDRIEAQPYLDDVIQDVMTESLDQRDPLGHLCCWLVNNIEEQEEEDVTPDLHACWLPGADCEEAARSDMADFCLKQLHGTPVFAAEGKEVAP